MDNESAPVRARSLRKRWPLRRGKRINGIVAGISWTGVLFVVVNLVHGWWIRILTPDNLITLAFAGIGCALGGVLALTGDGDVILFTGADEGQRDAIREAVLPAFSIAFWGMFLLWIGYSFWPSWRASAYLHIGLLLLLVLAVYLGGYLWRRRRP